MLLAGAWILQDRWVTVVLELPALELPPNEKDVVNSESGGVNQAPLDARTILAQAESALKNEPCDRVSLQRFIGAATQLNSTRAILTRSEAFERECGEWAFLAMARAEVHSQLSEYEDAARHYDRWVSLDKMSPLAWAARAGFKKQQQDVSGAIDDFQKALLLEPGLTDVPQWLATLLIEDKRPCEAIPVLEQLLVNRPDMVENPRVRQGLVTARNHPDCSALRGQGKVLVQLLGRDQMLDVDARIGGRSFAAVLDTGASFVTLPESVAVTLGLELDSASTLDVSVIGDVRSARRVVLDRISIGKATAEKVPAIVVKEVFPGADTILLGMSFLSRFRVTYDPTAQTLELTAPQ